MKKELIAQGAESKLFRQGDLIIKDRVRKSYRIKQLGDRLRKHRTRVEARMLKKAGKLVNAPKVRAVTDFKIEMNYVDGEVLRDLIPSFSKKQLKKLMSELGLAIARLHKNDLIHGDLTTSNLILKSGELFFIDFGLSEVNQSFEAKAVDLHLLKQALKSKHYRKARSAWISLKKAYSEGYGEASQVLKRLKRVERRGRYKNK